MVRGRFRLVRHLRLLASQTPASETWLSDNQDVTEAICKGFAGDHESSVDEIDSGLTPITGI